MENRLLDLSNYRMDKAKEDLEASELMFKNGKFSQSINRSYYAIFHAVRALLALDKFDLQKHSGIISYFNHNYIKTGKIEVEFSKMLTSAFKIRSDSDYKDFYIVTREDANIQLENANKFLKRIQEYLAQIES